MDMNYGEAKTICDENGQGQILAFYDELGEKEREILLSQIEKLDFSLPKLVTNPVPEKRGTIAPIPVMEIEEIRKRREEFYDRGVKCIQNHEVAAVLLAGGQGTRLGLDKPKGMLNVGETHSYYLFEILIENLMDVVKETGTSIPLYIMTSEKNHEDTVHFFEEMEYFGYNKNDIAFFKQSMAPCVDREGKFLLEESYKLCQSPNGNGGWFTSLAQAGLLADAKERGVGFLNVFSVDNVLQRIADPVFIGAMLASGQRSASKVIRKAYPEEKVGVMCLEDGYPSIVEYYELSDEMRYAVNEEGSLQYGFGVILNYLFQIQDLEEVMDKKIPVHMAEKKIPYVNGQGEYVKPESPNGFKFETLILDLVHMMGSCLPFEVIREYEFAPIKNKRGADSLETARELLKKNGKGDKI